MIHEIRLIFFILIFMCVFSYPWKLEDGTEFFEAGVTSSFMPPDVSAGIQISVLWYINKYSKWWGISPNTNPEHLMVLFFPLFLLWWTLLEYRNLWLCNVLTSVLTKNYNLIMTSSCISSVGIFHKQTETLGYLILDFCTYTLTTSLLSRVQ